MMKRLFRIFFWIALLAYYVATLSFVSLQQREAVCKSVYVAVLDSASVHFVTAADIARLVDNRQHKVRGMLMDSIRTSIIEARLMKVSAIEKASVYKTSDGTVHVDILQRVPLLRVINRYGDSFYIDDKGYLLRHVNRYSVHVLVANGYIDLKAPQNKTFNIASLAKANGKQDIVQDLYDLAVWIDSHKFWKAQIQQLYVNADDDIELVPLVGSHTIIFGKGDRINEKFSMLESLYRNGLNVKGWNSYSIINLKYEGQIVCTRRE